MSIPIIILMAVLQFYVAGEQLFKGNIAAGIMFGGYAVSNIAYIWLVK